MRRSRTGPAVGVGLALHILVGGLMLFAGSGKCFGFAPAKVVDNYNTMAWPIGFT